MSSIASISKNGVIHRGPSEWTTPIVSVMKKNGDVRICVDLKRLNEALVPEKFVMPTMDELLPKLAGATVFIKLEASSGFWSIPLDKESSHLTCSLTSFGRYAFDRLCVGITSGPEILQHRMAQLLKNHEGMNVFVDDILILHGKTQGDHDKNLRRVLKTIQKSGLKLNRRKCEF